VPYVLTPEAPRYFKFQDFKSQTETREKSSYKAWDFGPQTSDFRLQASDFGLQEHPEPARLRFEA
jgi:hypothetical protein